MKNQHPQQAKSLLAHYFKNQRPGKLSQLREDNPTVNCPRLKYAGLSLPLSTLSRVKRETFSRLTAARPSEDGRELQNNVLALKILPGQRPVTGTLYLYLEMYIKPFTQWVSCT